MDLCPVILLADRSISDVDTTATALMEGLADVVTFLPDDENALSDAQLAVAIGGDGTLINHGPMLAMRGIPLVGVNCGKLGFLAKFDAQSLIEQREAIFPEPPPSFQAMMLEVGRDQDQATIAMNEAMIAAGNPFRILELGLSINDIPAPRLHSDGIILSTPIGSTAHSASVGGPIVDPSANAFVLTPVAAHSLANRPIVLDAGAKVTVDILKANEGTALVIDGKVHCGLAEGMQVHVKQSESALSIVLNPSSTYWNTLVDKLHWAAPAG